MFQTFLWGSLNPDNFLDPKMNHIIPWMTIHLYISFRSWLLVSFCQIWFHMVKNKPPCSNLKKNMIQLQSQQKNYSELCPTSWEVTWGKSAYEIDITSFVCIWIYRGIYYSVSYSVFIVLVVWSNWNTEAHFFHLKHIRYKCLMLQPVFIRHYGLDRNNRHLLRKSVIFNRFYSSW